MQACVLLRIRQFCFLNVAPEASKGYLHTSKTNLSMVNESQCKVIHIWKNNPNVINTLMGSAPVVCGQERERLGVCDTLAQ